MHIQEEEQPSPLKIFGILASFTVLGLVFVVVPVEFFKDLLIQINERRDEIVFEKGMYYLFGGGIFFLLLVIGFFMVKVLKASDRFQKILLTLMAFGFILMFTLPHIIHFFIANHMEKTGYVICKEKSRRWLHNVTIVYTKTLPCAEDKQSTSSGGGARIY